MKKSTLILLSIAFISCKKDNQVIPVTYGTELSGTQLVATSSVGGTFTYTPSVETILLSNGNTIVKDNTNNTISLLNPGAKKIFSVSFKSGRLNNIYFDAGTPAANSCLQKYINACISDRFCFLLCNTSGWGGCILGWLGRCTF